MRHRRFIAYILIASLSLGVFASGLSVMFNHAKADSPSDYVLYWDDFKSEMLQLATPTQYTYQMLSLLNEVESYWENSSFNVFIMTDGIGNWSFLSLLRTNGTGFMGSGWNNPTEYQLTSGAWPSYFREEGTFCYYNGSFRWCNDSSTNISNPSARRSIIDFETSGNPDVFYCTPFEFNAAGWKCYSLRGISSGNANGYSMPGNMEEGSAPPTYVEFNVVVFYLGERRYFSFLEQDIFRDMMPDHMDYMLGILHDNEDMSALYTWEDVTLLPGAENFVNVQFSNVSPAGVYGIDITDKDWVVLDVVSLISFDSDLNASYAGVGVNCPYRIPLTPGEDGTSDSYTQSWSTFYSYYDTYNNTHIVPETLAETLFGINGSKLYPCSVSVPRDVYNHSGENDGTSFADIHTWQWWFASRSDLGINFELLDTVIISYSSTGEYSLVYYYSDSLNVPFQYVQNVSFSRLTELFDVIIIVPDSKGCLIGNTWWKSTLSSICSILNINPAGSLLNSLAISGSSSLGVEYVSSRPEENARVLDGFCIVTHKAIQRQQLYVFNDGITKTYKLMSDYIDKRGDWEDSFLAWTASLFAQWQTLDGHLSDIYNLLYSLDLRSWLDDIQTKLDRLIENTSEDDTDHVWYTSLLLWVIQFKPTEQNFVTSLDNYDDIWDDVPLLPEPSTVPLLPTIGG